MAYFVHFLIWSFTGYNGEIPFASLHYSSTVQDFTLVHLTLCPHTAYFKNAAFTVFIDHSPPVSEGSNNARYSPGDIPFSSRKTLLKLDML